jgi:hypothetical protein
MLSADGLCKAWANRVSSSVIESTLTITEDGLVLGAGTVLAKRRMDRWDRSALAIEGQEEHIVTLLSLAYGRIIDPSVMVHIERASLACSQGDTCLALIYLAYTGLPALPDEKLGSYRLFLADAILSTGVSPRDLLIGCGLDPAPLNVLRAGYNPNQLRVPAGQPDGGQWTGDNREGDAETRSNGNSIKPISSMIAWANLSNPAPPLHDHNEGGSALLTEIAYQGAYHDALVTELANTVRSSGGAAVTEVPLIAVGGTSARADMIVRPHGWDTPFVVEVKTGPRSGFTPNQATVYQLLPIGGHVTATKSGLEAVGLESGQPLPPIRLLIIYSAGPGQLEGDWWPPLP